MCVEEVSSQNGQLIRPRRKRKLGGRRDRGKVAPTHAQGLHTCSPCRDTHRAVRHPEIQAGWNINELGGGGRWVTAEQEASAFLRGPELRCPRFAHQNPVSLPALFPAESKQWVSRRLSSSAKYPGPQCLETQRKINVSWPGSEHNVWSTSESIPQQSKRPRGL